LLTNWSDTPSGRRGDLSRRSQAKEWTMNAKTMHAAGARSAKRSSFPGADGLAGTITGGGAVAASPITDIGRGAQCVSRSGAVSGAAQGVAGGPAFPGGLASGGPDRWIALSDGSRITFASIADAGILRDDETPLLSGF
jgi:hypothetical protein